MLFVFTAASLLIVGMIFGSFAGAQLWRFRARQLDEDEKRLKALKTSKIRNSQEAAEYRDLTESARQRRLELVNLRPLLTESAKTDRSRCLSCQHRLAWYDLLPVVSWLSTGGKCRYCSKPIGKFELLIEAGLGLFWMLSFVLWPISFDTGLSVLAFGVWLAASVPLAILFAYDAKWYLLPDLPMLAFIGLAAIFATIGQAMAGVDVGSLLSLLGAVAAIGGLYWLLHAISAGRWVGYGDATLGVGLGLLLGDWRLAIVAVILANIIGTLMVLPALLSARLDRKSHIAFGPLLIAGTMLTFFFGQPIIDWYFGFL